MVSVRWYALPITRPASASFDVNCQGVSAFGWGHATPSWLWATKAPTPCDLGSQALYWLKVGPFEVGYAGSVGFRTKNLTDLSDISLKSRNFVFKPK